MAHLGWIYGVGGYIGGILTMLYGPVGKYSLDKANELKELIVEIRRSISDFENHRLKASLPKYLFNSASDLKTKLELIQWYGLIRYLARLPPKKNINKAAALLPQLADEVRAYPIAKGKDLAKKIKRPLGVISAGRSAITNIVTGFPRVSTADASRNKLYGILGIPFLGHRETIP
jgi:hypothetical protein